MTGQHYYNPDRAGGYQPKGQSGTKIIKMTPPDQGSSVMPPKSSKTTISTDCVYCVMGTNGYGCKDLESVWATYELAKAHIEELGQRDIMFYVQACPVRGIQG